MSLDSFELPLPVARQVELPQPIIEAPQQVADVHVALPTQEHARAVERAFASHPQGHHDALGNLMGLAVAGMLLHDVVSDTLAEPEEEEEEEKEANEEQ
jgi:cytochrome b